MPMYSRSAKIICILKGSSVQSMKNLVPPLRLDSSYMMTLNPPISPPLCSSKSQKQKNYAKVLYMVSSYRQFSQAKLFPRLFTYSQAKLTPHLHWHTKKKLLFCTFSNSLTNNQANLTEPKVQFTTKDVKKEGRLCMKFPLPRGEVCKEGF